MRQARILLNGTPHTVTADQAGQPETNKNFAWLPATNGSVIGLALNNRPLMDKLAPELTEAPYKNPPKTPVYFFKPVNTHLAHQGTIQVPANGESAFAGAALGIVIGQTARKVKRADAASVIAGYTVVNEVSLAETSYYRPAIKAKCRDTFCPIGPWVVPANELDVSALAINTYINGELRQRGNTADLIYSVPEIIEYLSDFMTLQAGDLIIAGTTLREVALAAGDVVAVEIEGIGRLENPITLETGAAK